MSPVTKEPLVKGEERPLLARMSHDLRTPVSGVLGLTGLLLHTPLTPDQREYAEAVHLSATTMLRIINDNLDRSRIEAGMITNAPALFDPHETVREALELLGPQTDAKGLTLALRFSPEVPSEVVGDAWRIRQVLLNLVGHSIRSTRAGYVSIELECLRGRPGGALLQVRVRDSGAGIHPSELDRDPSGAGLGLAISRQLVEMMGG
ncbi:MAG: histidine kinase dimerization/phospho-acceptor domain-containing protein, partial [Bryobacteraceae bacterium]